MGGAGLLGCWIRSGPGAGWGFLCPDKAGCMALVVGGGAICLLLCETVPRTSAMTLVGESGSWGLWLQGLGYRARS